MACVCCSNLPIACEFNHPKCVEILLTEGENPNTPNNRKYALVRAAAYGDGECLRRLLECDDIDISVGTGDFTAIEMAAFHGCLQNVKMILDSGVGDPNIRGAISAAVSGSKPEVLEFLLQLKPEICIEDEIAAAKREHSHCHSAASESCLRVLTEYEKTKSTRYYLVIVNSRHSDPDVYLIEPEKVSEIILQQMREQMGDYPSFLYTWKKGADRPPSIEVKFDELQNFTVCRTFFYNA